MIEVGRALYTRIEMGRAEGKQFELKTNSIIWEGAARAGGGDVGVRDFLLCICAPFIMFLCPGELL